MIKEIKWDNHNVLKNLDLKLTKSDGSIYKTIILAGNNGCGKTTILNTLAEFLKGGSIEPFLSIEYIANNKNFRIEKLGDIQNSKNNNISGFHIRKDLDDIVSKEIYTNQYNNIDELNNDTDDLRYYGFVYSRARSGFTTNEISSTSSQLIDATKFNYDDERINDFTDYKQLMIDINAQDNDDYAELGRKENTPNYNEFIKQSKMYRFTNAFNNFFERIKYEGIKVTNRGTREVYFSKDGLRVPLDSLSTGEKQIVFRGIQLLKNVKLINDGIVLIDEPELSMHPKWQQKIIDYYKGLFSNENGQFDQLFIATHSEYVIKSALNDQDALVIILKNENGSIIATKVERPFVLANITAAEVNFKAFNIYSTDYHNQLYCCLQNKINEEMITKCDEYIKNNHLYNVSYSKPSSRRRSNGNVTNYFTLPTYIRNEIDHSNGAFTFTEEELIKSTDLLIKLCDEIS